MKGKLPKQFRGYGCPAIFDVELNDLDLEDVLLALFFTVRSRGLELRKSKADPNLETYVKKMLASDKYPLKGFSGRTGKELLEAWLRTAVVRVGRRGLRHEGEVIHSVRPLHYLASNAIFRSTGFRRAHGFIYTVLCNSLLHRGVGGSPRTYLHDRFVEAFGPGIQYRRRDIQADIYCSSEELDVEQVLCLLFLNTVPAASMIRVPKAKSRRPRSVREPEGEPPSLPVLAHEIGEDLLAFLLAYRHRLSSRGLIQAFLALLSVSLNTYTRALMDLAARGFGTGDGVWPRDHRAPETYFDFTDQPDHASYAMARASVERDLSRVPRLLRMFFLFRCLEEYVVLERPELLQLKESDGPRYLTELLRLMGSSDVDLWAGMAYRSVVSELDEDGAVDGAGPGHYLEALAEVIYRVQSKKATRNAAAWLRDVSAMNRPYGCLQGNVRGPRRWHYTLNRTTLATLVNLACIRIGQGNWDLQSPPVPQPVRLVDFLDFLRDRFGILIASPPAWLDSVGNRAAARDNLEALKRRLHHMGYFMDLSDDFAAQHLRPPVCASETEEALAQHY